METTGLREDPMVFLFWWNWKAQDKRNFENNVLSKTDKGKSRETGRRKALRTFGGSPNQIGEYGTKLRREAQQVGRVAEAKYEPVFNRAQIQVFARLSPAGNSTDKIQMGYVGFFIERKAGKLNM